MTDIALPLELFLIISPYASLSALKNLRCASKALYSTIAAKQLVFAYAQKLWEAYSDSSLYYLCKSKRLIPGWPGRSPTCTRKAFQHAPQSVLLTLVPILKSRGAFGPERYSSIVDMAVNSINEPLFKLLHSNGIPPYPCTIDDLLRSCRTDPYLFLKRVLVVFLDLRYNPGPLIAAAEKGYHIAIRMLLSQCDQSARRIPPEARIEIWKAAVRDNDIKSIRSVVTRAIPHTESLLATAIEFKSVSALEWLLEYGAKGKGSYGQRLLASARESGSQEVVDLLIAV
ncbi:hypothetical protein HK097_003837 [Rhizophlyctis rosea]|uniref:F-box domain-containing protein n=1 Tax=Rhizophlyctis rosea TaxID=64517 RepID=A0AAD5SHQ5_9FUNG|nr:hypothetical protein HK097_003837 [Rhizophlyctis rosea]